MTTKNKNTTARGKTDDAGTSGLVGHIWLVRGACGEYSDHAEWVVCAYSTEEEAKKHAALAKARADALYRQYTRCCDIPAGANEYDPQMQCASTGTHYSHEMTELRFLA